MKFSKKEIAVMRERWQEGKFTKLIALEINRGHAIVRQFISANRDIFPSRHCMYPKERKSKNVMHLYMDKNILDELRKLASDRGCHASTIVKQLILKELNNNDKARTSN